MCSAQPLRLQPQFRAGVSPLSGFSIVSLGAANDLLAADLTLVFARLKPQRLRFPKAARRTNKTATNRASMSLN